MQFFYPFAVFLQNPALFKDLCLNSTFKNGLAYFSPSFQVVGNLLKKPNAKAVVLFTRAEDAR